MQTDNEIKDVIGGWIDDKISNIHTALPGKIVEYNPATNRASVQPVGTYQTADYMIPLNAKQQKSSRLMNRLNPELQAIRDKYKDKKDSDSVMKMNTETQAVYTKYGISPFGGCLPLIISMPILFALYGIIGQITTYVPSLEGATNFLWLDVSQSPNEYAKVTKFAYLIPILAVVFQFINTKMLQVKNDKNNQQQDSMAASMKMMNYFIDRKSVV